MNASIRTLAGLVQLVIILQPRNFALFLIGRLSLVMIDRLVVILVVELMLGCFDSVLVQPHQPVHFFASKG